MNLERWKEKAPPQICDCLVSHGRTICPVHGHWLLAPKDEKDTRPEHLGSADASGEKR